MQSQYQAQSNAHILPKYLGGVGIGLGIVQGIIGILVIIFEIIARLHDGRASESYTGIWMGVIFLVTGVFGVLSGVKKTRFMVVLFMVLSIISAVLAGGLCIYGSMAWILQGFTSQISNTENYAYRYKVIYAMIYARIAAGILEIIIAIVSAAFCCAGCCGSSSQTPGVIIMTHTNQPIQPNPQGSASQQQPIMYQQGHLIPTQQDDLPSKY